jgi:ribonuclease BN (tRNA processing enzyme)
MRIRVLGCAGGSAPGERLSCYLIDERLAIDAGALTTGLALEAQRQVEAVVFTHGHLDHVWSLPLFLANRFGGESPTCHVHASAFTQETIRTHLFNDRIWPDFTAAKIEDRPLVAFHDFEPGSTQTVLEEYEFTSVALDHTVPCQGYRIRTGQRSVIICGDTTSTEALWTLADASDDLAGILVECSFPDKLESLARLSGHMTPRLLLADLGKLRRDVPVHVMHLKPGYGPEIRESLRAGGDGRVRFLSQGAVLEF